VTRPERQPSRARHTTVVTGVLCFWLPTATMNAYRGGDDAVVVPALAASVACLALDLGLRRCLFRR
jgi:hypothetical protein